MRARDERIQGLARSLRHGDPAELAFQIAEIAGDLAYQRHGVEVREGDIVLDVGANVGVAATFFAVHCGAATVHSFEPVAPIFEQLRRNVTGFPACVTHPYGLSSVEGSSSITYYPASAVMSSLYADPRRDGALLRTAMLNMGLTPVEADRQLVGRYRTETLECRLRTLSSFLAEQKLGRIDLLKIDVERAELDVLEGIQDQDWPKISQLAMEVHENDHLRIIESTLSARGFRVVTEQEPVLQDTPVRMLYASRR